MSIGPVQAGSVDHNQQHKTRLTGWEQDYDVVVSFQYRAHQQDWSYTSRMYLSCYGESRSRHPDREAVTEVLPRRILDNAGPSPKVRVIAVGAAMRGRQ